MSTELAPYLETDIEAELTEDHPHFGFWHAGCMPLTGSLVSFLCGAVYRFRGRSMAGQSKPLCKDCIQVAQDNLCLGCGTQFEGD